MCDIFPLQRQVSMTTALVRHHGRSVHKRSTIEILVRGKASGGSGGAGGPGGGGDTPQGCYSHPHRFEKYNNTTPSYCDHCTCLLWGPLKVCIGKTNHWNTRVWIINPICYYDFCEQFPISAWDRLTDIHIVASTPYRLDCDALIADTTATRSA